MTNDFKFYHGLVLAKIIHETQRPLTVRLFSPESNSSYILNDNIGIHIKYSSKRLTPWRFTFKPDQLDEIDKMKGCLNKVFLLLVCNEDGVVCLSHGELKQLLDNQHGPLVWISATRRKRQMYYVKGSDGELDFKIGKNDFPEKIFAAATDNSDALAILPEAQTGY